VLADRIFDPAYVQATLGAAEHVVEPDKPQGR
jgi:hypothetical protein